MVQSLWKTILCFLKKLKVELPYDPAIPFLSIYPKELKARTGTAIIWTPTFIAALSQWQKVEAAQVSTD